MATDDRGVSELLSFAFSFAVIITSVTLVFTAGFGALETAERSEQINSAERAMDVLASNLNAIQRGDPARTSEIRLGGGSLGVQDRTELRITVDGGGSSFPFTYTVRPRSLVYSNGDERIRYTTGGVFRGGPAGSVVSRPPTFVCRSGSDGQAVVPVLELEQADSRTVSTDGSVTVNGRQRTADLRFPASQSTSAGDATVVRIEVVSSPTPQAWGRYFDRTEWSSAGPDTYECSVGAGEVHVRRTVVGVEFLV
jgi:hypothetical protein